MREIELTPTARRKHYQDTSQCGKLLHALMAKDWTAENAGVAMSILTVAEVENVVQELYIA